jgi:hypothetical protein
MAHSTLSLFMDDAASVARRKAELEERKPAPIHPVRPEDLGAEPIDDEEMEKILHDHLSALRELFKALRKGEASLKIPKCKFLLRAWPMLGLITDGRHFAIDPSRTSGFNTLAAAPPKRTLSWLRMVVGVLTAHMGCVEHWGRLSAPLFALMKRATNDQRTAATPEERRLAAALPRGRLVVCGDFNHLTERRVRLGRLRDQRAAQCRAGGPGDHRDGPARPAREYLDRDQRLRWSGRGPGLRALSR